MKDKIEFDIINFGSINKANIELKKLNVVCGVNKSGKSTVSKLLFCLTSNSQEGVYLANNSIYTKFLSLLNFYYSTIESDSPIYPALEELLQSTQNMDLKNNNFNNDIAEKFDLAEKISKDFPNNNKLLNELKNLKKMVEVNKNPHYNYNSINNMLLHSEFDFSQLKNYKQAEVHLHGNIGDYKFSCQTDFKKDKIESVKEGNVNYLNFENIIYIDSPSILNNTNYRFINSNPYHLSKLYNLLTVEKNNLDVYDELYFEKLIKCQEKIEEIIKGKIYYDSTLKIFKFREKNYYLPMKNTASGIKQLGIIQLLLENRQLKENDFLFIDEPEISLHPEWQVKLAKILILLIKELNIHLYINSHSPQFIEALEVYSGKYGLIEDSNFYLSELQNNEYVFKKIPWDNLNILYKNLTDAYDTVDEIRLENIKNKIF